MHISLCVFSIWSRGISMNSQWNPSFELGEQETCRDWSFTDLKDWKEGKQNRALRDTEVQCKGAFFENHLWLTGKVVVCVEAMKMVLLAGRLCWTCGCEFSAAQDRDHKNLPSLWLNVTLWKPGAVFPQALGGVVAKLSAELAVLSKALKCGKGDNLLSESPVVLLGSRSS